MSSTFIIIGFTALISFMAFKNQELKFRLLFYPHRMREEKEWYRYFSSGLIHADFQHLLFNMFTLFFFGQNVEQYLHIFGGDFPETKFWILYFGSMLMSGMFSYYKHQDNHNYMALGASGAVSGVLFSAILFDPWGWLFIFGAIPIPGILFGVGYLFYSAKMAKEARDNIGHDAHFYGAIAGVVLTLLFNAPAVASNFIEKILHPTNPF